MIPIGPPMRMTQMLKNFLVSTVAVAGALVIARAVITYAAADYVLELVKQPFSVGSRDLHPSITKAIKRVDEQAERQKGIIRAAGEKYEADKERDFCVKDFHGFSPDPLGNPPFSNPC
jgi:hypothetical protein